MSVAIVVPAHNEAGTIERCLSAVQANSYPAAQIIVVADACTDNTAALARAAGAEVLEADHRNKSQNVRAALAHVRAEHAVVIDADTFLAPDALKQLMRVMRRGGYAGVCGAVLPRSDQRHTLVVRARAVEYAVARWYARPAQSAVGRLSVLSGAFACYRVDVLREVGIPDVPIGEDTHLTWQLQAAGHRLGFAHRAIAYTTEPDTWRQYRRQVRRWASSSAQVITTYPRQLAHPGRALVVGAWLFDLLGASLLLPLALVWALTSDIRAMAGVGAIHLLTSALAFTLTAVQYGPLRAASYWPAAVLVGFATRWIYTWALFREWVLGAHFTSWTGRHDRPTIITRPSSWRIAATVSAPTAAVVLAAHIL